MNTAEQDKAQTLVAQTAAMVEQASQEDFQDLQQFLTFVMQGEEYGIDILNVQEIRGWGNVAPIPNAPAHVSGVINLRGAIVPVIDLRVMFALQGAAFDENTVVIVLKVETDRVDRIMGIVVDAVSDVFSLSEDSKRPPPNVNQNISQNYINGLTEVKGKMVILLDSEKLLDIENH
jgi:purine-binding chemotaxis protein CheW